MSENTYNPLTDRTVCRWWVQLQSDNPSEIRAALREVCERVVEENDLRPVDALLHVCDPQNMTAKAARGLCIVTLDARADLPSWQRFATQVMATHGPCGSGIEAALMEPKDTTHD